MLQYSRNSHPVAKIQMLFAWMMVGAALAQEPPPADEPRDESTEETVLDAEPDVPQPEVDPELELLQTRIEVLEAMVEVQAEMAAEAAASAPPPAAAAAAAAGPVVGRRGGPQFQSMNPDLSFISDVAGAYFTDEDPRMTGGHDPLANGFNLQQLELSVGSAVDPFFRFDGNIVFSQFGVEIEEAYGTSLALPGRLQVRAGQFLTRFGRINNSHPHSWDFVDQTLMIGRNFGGEGNRGLGGELSWLTPLPWSVEVIGSQTMANGASTARSFYGGQDLGVDRIGDLQSTLAVKQFFPLGPDWSLYWGLSYAGGPNPTGRTNRTEMYGTDLYLRFYPASSASNQHFTLTFEGLQRRRQVPDDVWVDYTGYVALRHHFAPRWAWAVRQELGTGARTLDDEVAADDLDPLWTGNRSRSSANVTFWATEFSRFRLQGQRDEVRWEADPEYAVFFAVEFVTGAHGAHKF